MSIAQSKASLQQSFHSEAILYAQRGWSIIPTRRKRSAGLWKPFQKRRPDAATSAKLFSKRGLTGLAVILGAVSGGLVCIDFDDEQTYFLWIAQHPEAAAYPTAKTSRGYHIYGLGQEDYFEFPGGEYRGDSKHFCLLPPSIHPDGPIYTWVVPLPTGPLPVIPPEWVTSLLPKNPEHPTALIALRQDLDLDQVEFAVRATLPTQFGQRNRCVFDLARRLRGLGIASADEAKPIVTTWWNRALPKIRTKEWQETWDDFIWAWDQIKAPLRPGLTLAEANAQAREKPDSRYGEPELQHLVALCSVLARQWAPAPFPLGCREAAQCLTEAGIPTKHGVASWMLTRLVKDRVLKLAREGHKAVGDKPGRSNEYHFSEVLVEHSQTLARYANEKHDWVPGRDDGPQG